MKNTLMFIDFWFPNQGPDMIGRLPLDLLPITTVGRSGKVMEKGMPKVIKIGLQIEGLAVQAMIFESWGGFEKF